RAESGRAPPAFLAGAVAPPSRGPASGRPSTIRAASWSGLAWVSAWSDGREPTDSPSRARRSATEPERVVRPAALLALAFAAHALRRRSRRSALAAIMLAGVEMKSRSYQRLVRKRRAWDFNPIMVFGSDDRDLPMQCSSGE